MLCAVLNEEWDDIVEYAKRYLNLFQDDYKVIWWKLFNSPDSTKWTNVLVVVELLLFASIKWSRTCLLPNKAGQE